MGTFYQSEPGPDQDQKIVLYDTAKADARSDHYNIVPAAELDALPAI